MSVPNPFLLLFDIVLRLFLSVFRDHSVFNISFEFDMFCIFLFQLRILYHEPSSSILVMMVASNSGVYPSSIFDPFIIGTPATATLSLMPIVLPASLPVDAPLTSHFQYLYKILVFTINYP